MTLSKHPAVRLTLLSLAAACLLAAVYWPGLYGAFIFDDAPNIVNNPLLRAFDGSFDSLLNAATSGTSSPWGRPLSMASFALNFYFFGDAPFSFKLTNLVIHLANSALVFTLVWQLLRRFNHAGNAASSWLAALWITAVWALHPINLTPVLYVVQRMTSLAAFFMLVGLNLYLVGRQAQGRKGAFAIALSALFCWPAAVLSKETGLIFPIYILLCEWLLFGSFRGLSGRLRWFGGLGIGTLLAGMVWAKWSWVTGGYSLRDFDLVERLMTQGRVLWFYLRQLLLPESALFALFHDDIAISRGLLSPPATLLAIGAWVALIGLAWQQRARRPLFAFAVFWFLASHLLESTVLPLEIAYEHRNYTASLGIFLWLASLLFSDAGSARWQLPKWVLAGSLVFYYGLLTGVRSVHWSNEFQRTKIEVRDHPESASSHLQAALFMMLKTFASGAGSPAAYQTVRFHFSRVVELDRDDKVAAVGLIYLDCEAGKPKNQVDRARMFTRFASTNFSQSDRAMISSLSGLLREKRLCLNDDEVKQLIEAGITNPHANGVVRGLIYAMAMDHAQANMRSIPLALTYAQAGVRSDPGTVAYRINLIYLYLQADRPEDARTEYEALANWRLSASDQSAFDKLKPVFETH